MDNQEFLTFLSEWLPEEEIQGDSNPLSNPKFREMASKIEIVQKALQKEKSDVEKYRPNEGEFQPFLHRELPYHREYEIIQYLIFHPHFGDQWVQAALDISEQRDREEEEALKEYDQEQKVISIEKIRERLLHTIQEAEFREIPSPFNFIPASVSQPVSLDDIGLTSREGVFAAAGGDQLKRQKISEEGAPAEIELTRFGEKVTIFVRITQADLPEGLIRIAFFDKENEFYACLIPIVNGSGKRSFREQEFSLFEKVTESVKIYFRLITLPAEIAKTISLTLEDVRDSADAIMLLEPLISHPSPLVRRMAVCLLGIMCGETSLEIIENSMKDNETSVCQIAKHITKMLSHE
jgi:hypothetical protein